MTGVNVVGISEAVGGHDGLNGHTIAERDGEEGVTVLDGVIAGSGRNDQALTGVNLVGVGEVVGCGDLLPCATITGGDDLERFTGLNDMNGLACAGVGGWVWIGGRR